jgi:hypothetical protein
LKQVEKHQIGGTKTRLAATSLVYLANEGIDLEVSWFVNSK